MRHFLIFPMILSLLAGCSYIQPHRIDVQQGNALDQENVARLKPGLSRSQVRFLLGTPLLVDPFHTNRWDYVYVFYQAGKLAEQKRITLFFESDTLTRIDGSVPSASAPVAEPVPDASVPAPVPQPLPETPGVVPVPAAMPSAAAASAPAVPTAVPANTASDALNLKSETNVMRIKPDVMPSFPEAPPPPASGEAKP